MALLNPGTSLDSQIELGMQGSHPCFIKDRRPHSISGSRYRLLTCIHLNYCFIGGCWCANTGPELPAARMCTFDSQHCGRQMQQCKSTGLQVQPAGSTRLLGYPVTKGDSHHRHMAVSQALCSERFFGGGGWNAGRGWDANRQHQLHQSAIPSCTTVHCSTKLTQPSTLYPPSHLSMRLLQCCMRVAGWDGWGQGCGLGLGCKLAAPAALICNSFL